MNEFGLLDFITPEEEPSVYGVEIITRTQIQ